MKGPTGLTGPTGPTGPTGYTGPQGIRGPTGQIHTLRVRYADTTPQEYPEIIWKEVFVFHLVKVQLANGGEERAIFEKLFRGRVPAHRGQSGYYIYRRPKDHFLLELKGKHND
jgi:hypothetical protein